MYAIVNEQTKTIYKIVSSSREAFSALNELTVQKIPGHVHDVGGGKPESALETIDGPVRAEKPAAAV